MPPCRRKPAKATPGSWKPIVDDAFSPTSPHPTKAGQMSTSNEPSEEELQAAYEAEIKKIRVEQILLEQVVSLINLGMRRTGLAPGTEDERDIDQVRGAIEAVRALLPLTEQGA